MSLPIMGLTPLLFDTSGSTGESLTYAIDLGDGTTSTDARTVRPVMASGSLTARMTVMDKYGRTDSVARAFDVRSLVAYGWYHWSASYYRRLQIRNHQGRAISGVYLRWKPGIESGGEGMPFSGTLSGERTMQVALDDGSARFDGTVTDPLMGYCGVYPKLNLTISGSDPASGLTLPFEYYFGGC